MPIERLPGDVELSAQLGTLVLRCPIEACASRSLTGTRNSRADRLVEALTPVGQLWDFDLLADEILPLTRAEIIGLRFERAARRAHGQPRPRPARYFEAAGLWEDRLAELQLLLRHRWFGSLPAGERDVWLLLAGTVMGYLVPGRMVRREIYALADEVTGGHWSTWETASRLSSVICRAEDAALGQFHAAAHVC
jgi:hypothetical protein